MRSRTAQTLTVGQCFVEVEFALVMCADDDEETCSVLDCADDVMRIGGAEVVVEWEMVVVFCVLADVFDVLFGGVDILRVLRVSGCESALYLVDGGPDCDCSMLVSSE